jgi:hypothetical protein
MKNEQEIRDLIVQITLLKHKAINLKMMKTFYSLDDSMNAAGWELADKLTKEKSKKGQTNG